MLATQKMADDLASRVGEKEAEIMQGHMMLLSDPMLTGEIENSVKNDKVSNLLATKIIVPHQLIPRESCCPPPKI